LSTVYTRFLVALDCKRPLNVRRTKCVKKLLQTAIGCKLHLNISYLSLWETFG